MSDGDETHWTGRQTPLALAMESLRGDVLPLYNVGHDSFGRMRASELLSFGDPQGFVFWHDGEVERAALAGVMTVTYGTLLPGSLTGVWQRVSRAFSENGMRTVHGFGHHFDVWLYPADRLWFQERMYTMSEERYWDFFMRDRSPEKFRLRSVFQGFRRGLRELEAERGRAARLIGEAVMEWAFRPGGACAKIAKRSFANISA